ncbi:MAG TPA: SpoIIE family protein phosphatase, partial [Gemmataceae bacterium]|nr:SpoIIE family protein phosphatase [Gemmataceae bacterium]
MAITAPSQVLLISAGNSAPPRYAQELTEAGYEIAVTAFADLRVEMLHSCQLAIVEAGSQCVEALRSVRRCRAHLADGFVPILLIGDAAAPEARLAGLEAGADACLMPPYLPEEFLAQCRALLRVKYEHDRLKDKATEIASTNRRLQAAYEQVDRELELASRVQASFLPATLPELGWARFAVSYRPCGRVGGDFYDVRRLDEHHVGLYVADAMGHGVPASLLTIYLKQAVRGKEINGNRYRLLPPAEVLSQLNRDLIDKELADSRFITMVYGLLDGRDGTLHFA